MGTTPLDFTDIRWPAEPVSWVDGEASYGYLSIETEQRYPYGKRAIGLLGDAYRYCHSLGTLLSGFAAANVAPQNIGAVAPAAMAAGASEVVVTIASGDGYAANGLVAEDELVGGRIVCGHGESLVNNRIILGNTAVAVGGGVTRLKLHKPIVHAMTISSSYVEILLNFYRYLSKGALEYNAFICVPPVNVGSGYNFWGQTRGPCWVTPGGGDPTPGNTANDRTAYFVGDGSVNFGAALTVESGYQIAGYCIDQTASGTSAMPMIFLQLE